MLVVEVVVVYPVLYIWSKYCDKRCTVYFGLTLYSDCLRWRECTTGNDTTNKLK